MIYLWTNGEGWTKHEITETDELKKRDLMIGEGAKVGDGARVGYGARVGDGGRVGNGARPTIICIIGSRYPVAYWGEDRIDIGCEHHSITDWLSDGETIGKKHEFPPDQMVEYRRYVKLIAAIHTANPDTAKDR